jgi:hypothetical protein
MYKEVKETKIIFVDLGQNWDKTLKIQLYFVIISYTWWNNRIFPFHCHFITYNNRA